MRCTKPFSAIRLPRLLALFLVLASLLTVFVTFRLNTQTATAATNSTINFQARLMQSSGAIVPDGDYNVEFKIYNAVSSSGSGQGSCTGDAACLWTETRVATNKVRVVNGYLTANLGSVAALPAINWDQELWLTMNIGGTGTPGWDGEMSPRLKLTAVPYAFTAGQLATTNGSFRSNLNFVQPTANRSIQVPDESGTLCIQGSAACGFMTGSATDFIQNQNGVNQTANFRISGTGRANTSLMTPLLQPTADGATALKVQSTDSVVTAMTIDTFNGRVAIGADTAAQERLDVVGNLQVRDAATATKSYRLRTSGGGLDFEAAGASLVLSTWSGAGYTGTQYNQITFKSDGSSMDFARGFNVSDAAARVGLAGNVNPQYSLDVNGDINTSTQYRIGGVVICTATGCTPAAGSGNYIQNQNSADQTANFRINGTGQAGTALQAPLFDTATAAALNVGTTNATGINLNKATTITGNLAQSGGTISLDATGAGSLTATAALTLTAAAASTWSTSAGSLTIQAATTNTLNLRTGGAGTVAVGDINTTTIHIGRGSNIARTINIGNGGTSTAQTINLGSTGSTSTTAIQGGTGTGAISLTTGTNGGIALTSNGTGAIALTSGTGGVIVKPTADTGSAFQVQNAGGGYILNVNSVFGIVNIGLLNVGIGTNTGYIDTTNSGDTITIGATNAGAVSIGRTAAAVTIQGSAASTFKATSGSFTTTLGFITPTANRAINLPDESGTVCLQNSVNCGFMTGSAANYIQNTTTLQSANIAVQAATSGSVTAVLQANAAGTGDILSLRNGAGTAVATFGYNGQVLLKNSADSTTAFQVQNAAGTSVLVVDTTNQRVAIGNTAPALKFEVQGGDAAIYNSGNNARLVIGDSSTTGQYGWLQWDSANDYFRIETVGTNGLKINDNNVSIGNIFPSKPLIVGSGTVPLFEIGTTGQVQTRTSTNTTTALQMQNNLGDIYFNADSTNKRIGIGDNMIAPEVTLDVSGAIQQTGMETPNSGAADNNKWTKLGSCTLTAQFSQCLTKIEILGGYDGSTGNNTQATVTARVKQQNAMGTAPYVNITLNDTAEVITKADIVAVTTVNNGTTTTVELYGRVTNTFESWAYTPVLNSGGFGESTWDWSPQSAFIAALPAGVQQPARYGNVNANLLTVEATSVNAVVIQNAGGANKLLVADTQNLRLAVNQATAAYTLDVAGDINTTTQYRIGGTAICTALGCTASATSAILNQTTAQAANLYVQAATSGSVAGVLRANAAGVGDILQLKNGAGTNVALFGSTGAVTLQNSANSTAAFLIQASAGAGGNAVFRVDTTNERVAIGVISDPIAAKLNIATGTTVSLRAFQSAANDIFQLANSTADVFNVGSTGTVNTRTTTNNANAFRIQNSTGTQVLNVDTIENELFLGTSYSSKHFAANLSGNAFLEVGNSTGQGISITQVEGAGSAYITHDADLVIQRTATSATDFRILSPTDDSNLFTVDSANSRIVLGVSDTTGALLVLDTKTGAGDPTAVNGAMYYNSAIGSFRCAQSGVWSSCGGGLLSANTAASTAISNTTTESNFSTNYSIPANFCVAGRVIRVTANGTYGTAAATTPTLELRVKLGATSVGTTNLMTTASGGANRGWSVNFNVICNAAPAAAAAVNGQGFAVLGTNASGTPTTATGTVADMATGGTTNIATNAAQTLQLSADWGTASASNSIILRTLIVEGLGPSQ